MPLSHLPKLINFADILVTLFVAAESLASFVAPLRAFLAFRSCNPPSAAAVGSNDRLMAVHRGRSRRTAFSGVALPPSPVPSLFPSLVPFPRLQLEGASKRSVAATAALAAASSSLRAPKLPPKTAADAAAAAVPSSESEEELTSSSANLVSRLPLWRSRTLSPWNRYYLFYSYPM